MDIPERTDLQRLEIRVRSIRARLKKPLPPEEKEAAERALADVVARLSQLQQPQRSASVW